MATLNPPPSLQHIARTWIGPLVAAVLTAGCGDYFRPAVPEPPIGDPIFLDYSSPEATLATLALGLADKATTNGQSAYLRAFADSTKPETPAFHHFFDPAVVLDWELAFGRTAPSDWGLPLERNFYAYFIRRGGRFEMVWEVNEDLPDPLPEADNVVLNRKYRVTADTTIIAVGLASLTLRPTAGREWVIVHWVDARDPAFGGPEQITLGARRLESQ